MSYFTLNDGKQLPVIGLGTVHIQGATGLESILTALDAGYRLIDTSTNYHNEGMVGAAIRRTPISRHEILVTSKLPGLAHQYDMAIKLIQESLYRTGLDYFDIYLIHWPLPKRDLYVEAWQALIDAQKFGLIRSIGVSNFTREHLNRIIAETGVTPAINQIERHPYFNNLETVRANNELGILTQAWSPFGRDKLNVLEDPVIKELALKYDKEPSQIVIRWNLQQNVQPIVKAASAKHQLANLDVLDFELQVADIGKINALDRGEAGRIAGQDPDEYEEFE
ncbi:aldo/keto reductase [Aerococcaceae bacterium DSM 109653]|uniref:Aldo/keto reductase n=1 Tax=Fundicoccus ignavus TaxID=2664442 RepID=A0A844BXN0_9LACT|nr:aldo/keto reductase [Fundicoccus ignavus]MRI81236.1 aldo/keto reductase [Fundicoccus ignavus]